MDRLRPSAGSSRQSKPSFTTGNTLSPKNPSTTTEPKLSFFESLSRFFFPPPPPPPPEPRDALPEDSSKLDGILNYHFSQLDKIMSEVHERNSQIERLSYTYNSIRNEAHMHVTSEKLRMRIQGVRNARNLLARHVAFHLGEIDRTACKKQSLGGLRDVPDIFRHLPSEKEWTAMFQG
ncbi:hypothetical protein AJ80_02562 [Polytolypa hystricis UAMH7299]|uniref:Uncharacterized protein n=1 Tax=Polytolypa hystricis (strain UAMH7299) TaxID=1447883 RepID=A0A2B7YQ56_POLH7|nr:hypothetical protein AJ80_02562 [Polytolypa hystricis UAMH7299]